MRRVLLLVSLVSVAGVAALQATGPSAFDDWEQLRQRTREAFGAALQGAGSEGPAIVVGFTGGRQSATSPSSGVVQLRHVLDEQYAHRSDVAAHAYNNRHWKQAAADVVARVRATAGPAPVIVAYGHSLGAGSVTKFARALAEADLDVTLAIYVDAVSIRNPRVPGNVQFAVNLYQRKGLLRGFPLRGKRILVLEDEDRTTVLGSLRIRPQTTRFGWNWNLIQPLLYRHHHLIGHDIRLQDYVLDVIAFSVAEAGFEIDDAGSVTDDEL